MHVEGLEFPVVQIGGGGIEDAAYEHHFQDALEIYYIFITIIAIFHVSLAEEVSEASGGTGGDHGDLERLLLEFLIVKCGEAA